MRRTIVFTTALGSLFLAASAQASGLAVARFGGEHGNPVEDNATAIYYNPGALSASRGFNFFLDGSFAYRLIGYEHAELCPPGASPTQCNATESNNEYGEADNAIGSNYGEASLTNFAALPMIGASGRFPLGDDFGLAIGAGFFVPFGGSSAWDKNEAFRDHPRYPGAVDGVQRWYAIDGTLRSLFISGAVALSIHDIVHIGVSGGPAISQVDSIRAKAIDNSNNLDSEGRSWLKADGVHGHLGAGILVTPLEDRLRIGFSYQAPVGIDGVRMSGNLRIHDGTGQITDDPVDFHTVWPDIFRLGVSYKFSDDFQVRLHGNLVRWNLLDDQCTTKPDSPCEIGEDGTPEGETEIVLNLPRRWQLAGEVRAGASYWASDEVELFGGLGFDSSAVPDSTLEPALVDFNKISAALGGRFQFIEELAAAVSYTHFFYIPRDTTGPGVSENANFTSSSLGPDSGGKYSQILGMFNVNLEVSFDPWAPEPAPAAEHERLETAPLDEEPPPPVEPVDEPVPPPAEEPPPPVEEPPPPPVEEPPPPVEPPPADAPPVDEPPVP